MMRRVTEWFGMLFRVWRREFRLVFADPGVLVFFLLLPLLYPLVYTLIYNPELVKEIPVVMVDKSGSAQSRSLTRAINRAESMHVIGNAVDMADARQAFDSKHCYAIFEIPADYARRLGRGEQATVSFYCDMSLLLRYRQMFTDISNIQLAEGAAIQAADIQQLGAVGQAVTGQAPMIEADSYILGDPTQGFASFIMPGILVLILQQAMVLGVVMLSGGAAERRRRNGGVDPLMLDAPPCAMVVGKALCYLVIFAPMVIFTLHIVPWMFKLPHFGNFWDAVLLILPLLLASAFFGQLLGVFVTEREHSFLAIVFSSVLFLFISGLTWPRYAMNGAVRMLSSCVPATWGVEGFVHINSTHATLADQSHPYIMLWTLTGVYFVLVWVLWYIRRRNQRAALADAPAAD